MGISFSYFSETFVLNFTVSTTPKIPNVMNFKKFVSEIIRLEYNQFPKRYSVQFDKVSRKI